jgi:hypothetical protein
MSATADCSSVGAMLYFKISIVVLGCKYGNPYGYDS